MRCHPFEVSRMQYVLLNRNINEIIPMRTTLNQPTVGMNPKAVAKTRTPRTYKKRQASDDVARWCAIYPWYRKLVEDIRETLAARDSHCGDYHCVK